MKWEVRYVEPIVFAYVLCYFYSFPVEQQLIYRKVCLTHYNRTFCQSLATSKRINTLAEENIVHRETAQWDMYMGISRTIPSVLSTLVLGVWSDGVGRKTVLMFPVIGETVNAILYFVNAWFFSAPVGYLLIGNIITGIFGSFAAHSMATFAYISDVTTGETRTRRIIIIDALIYLASILSYFTGGIMLEKLGFVYLYSFVLGLHFITIVYIFFLKESYHPEQVLRLKDVFRGNRLTAAVRLVTENRGENYRMRHVLLLACFFIFFFQFMGINSVTILYVLHAPLSFHPSSIGYLLAEGNGIKFIGACVMGMILLKRYKWHDYTLILFNAIMMTTFTLCLGLSRTKLQVYMSFLFGFGLGVGNAACRSSLSKMISEEEQGKMSSIVGILQMLSTLFATVICNWIYKVTVNFCPSFTFYVVAGLSLLPILFSVLLMKYKENNKGSYEAIS